MLQAEGVCAGYGTGDVLTGIDVTVEPGTVTALVGANGAGKTTLLKTLTGLLRPRRGRVVADGRDVTELSCSARVRGPRIVMVPEGRQIFGGLSVEENLALGAWTGRDRSNWDLVWELFPALTEVRARPAGLLSGGQQQMVALGRGLLAAPRYLLLDEPSLGLAPLVVDSIFERIRLLAGTGIGVLVVEQNATVALAAAERGYVVEGGRIADEGTDLLDKPELVARFFGTRGVIRGSGAGLGGQLWRR
ncbi:MULTISPECIES: ABC transporter ATP-binding protein [Amycolatopsis]|uniref:ABC transporter ATP-binding protein n=1 Tax=Amycolatopsis dongchuanensis TaxID=1070866 RepID=A0ABP9QG88_9PSEU